MASVYGTIFPFLGELSGWDGLGGVLGRTGAQFTALAVSILIFVSMCKSDATAQKSA